MNSTPETQKIARNILAFIQDRNNILLTAHINSDGDAIASEIAMGLILEKLEKKYIMVFHDQNIDSRYRYLKNWDKIVSYKEDLNLTDQLPGGKIDSAIILDVPGIKRLGDVANLLPLKENIVKIDHHPIEDVFGPDDWVNEDASSTTAMVFEILEVSNLEIDAELAKAIYTGIVYDTGRFSFSNTTARDLAICARMVEFGVRPDQIVNDIFFENSFSALKIIGKGLYSLESHLDGAVNVVYLNFEDLQNGNQSEIEELVSEIKSSHNVIIFSQRRYGKTSLINKVLDTVRKDGILTIYMDLFHVLNEEDFVKTYAKALALNIEGTIERVMQVLKSIFTSLRPRINISSDGSPEFTFGMENGRDRSIFCL